jgi:hypothetical protein
MLARSTAFLPTRRRNRPDDGTAFVTAPGKIAPVEFILRLRPGDSRATGRKINEIASNMNALARDCGAVDAIFRFASWNQIGSPPDLVGNKPAFATRSRFSPCSFSLGSNR